uniref:ShKT domain-containing protein n=1 Tax=Caenorhabditis tropicalis TaxID=1561998 RepID=A0A1I7UMY8_9PELO
MFDITGLQEVSVESVEIIWINRLVEACSETAEIMTDSLSVTAARRPRQQLAASPPPQAITRRAASFPVNNFIKMRSAAGILILISIISIPSVYSEPKLPDCEQIPKVLCCTQRVLDKCMSGCIDYVTEKCPHKLEKYETIDHPEVPTTPKPTRAPTPVKTNSRVVGQVDHEAKEQFIDSKDIRRAPLAGDAKLLNQEYPITEVTDADLSSECGTEKSNPPSPRVSRENQPTTCSFRVAVNSFPPTVIAFVLMSIVSMLPPRLSFRLFSKSTAK